jgi:hypothetical protein
VNRRGAERPEKGVPIDAFIDELAAAVLEHK